ncbi:MAG TPA: glucoamylase family protein [Pyrinomonadaceae bacterium]|nr:glucoamylase family protein [Pyrinomonadaceae bacterium]
MKRQSFGDRDLHTLGRNTFNYFWKESSPATGLLADNTSGHAPASIAAVGHALASYTVGVERGWITRAEGVKRTLATLRFFANSPQGSEPDATGYKGFYYHFLDMRTGRRTWDCELSTIDTAILLAGALTAAAYFDQDTDEEREVRAVADALYRRADWQWALDGALKVSHGWKPESGFLKYRWDGYNEALILYVLGLGSPTYPLPNESYMAWTETYRWKKIYDIEFLYAGPLFIHQLSHIWIDFRGIQDDFMREHSIDYFENSRRAAYVQQRYAIRNPRGFKGYGEYVWGITASNGPGPAVHKINGVRRRFYDYHARSVPFGLDDGTLAPWATAASLPFAPEIVLPTLAAFKEKWGEMLSRYGIACSFNPTFPSKENGHAGWISGGHFGIDQGPVISMIENYRSGFIWRLMRQCPYIIKGLRCAGFGGGWLEAHS